MESFGDPSYVFHKRKGTTNKGTDYENLTMANLILTLTSNDTIKNFKIASNDRNFGAFDDIVLETETLNNEVKNYAIQLKYSKDRSLAKSSLAASCGSFSIKKYFQDYQKNNIDDFTLILYTNRKFDISKSDKKIEVDGFDLNLEEAEESLVNTGKSFRFIPNTEETFFDKFFLYTNQADVEKLTQQMKKYFQTCDSPNSAYRNYIDFISDWSSLEGKKTKLSKDLMRRKLALILLSSSIHALDFTTHPTASSKETLKSLINQCKTITFSMEQKSKLVRLWSETELNFEETESEVVRKLRRLYQTPDYTILLWLMGKCPLIVNDGPNLQKILNLCPEMNFVILSKHSPTLSTLGEEPLNYALRNFKCSLQGKEKIGLENLIQRGELKECITTDDLVKMTDSHWSIGEKAVLPITYLSRTLSRNVFDWTILDKIDFGLSRDTFLLITNYQETSKMNYRTVSSDAFFSVKDTNWEFCNDKIIFVTENEYSEEDFNEICCLNGAKRRYHQFRMIDEQLLEWVRSKNGIIDLSDFLLTDTYLSELDLRNSDYKIHIVCAGPGMGKTALMKSIKNTTSPTFWTMFIYVRNHCGYFSNKRTFIKHVLSEINDEFSRKVAEILIRERRVKYLWDALDEVTEESVYLILKLIEDFAKEGATQWITSRDNLKGILEKKFGVFARRLREFDEEEQERYVKESLRCSDNDIGDLFGKIQSNIRLFPDNNILGIPLQIYLLTELLRQDLTKYVDLLEKNIFSITDLYANFVDEKFNIYCREKEGIITKNDLFVERHNQYKTKKIECYEKVAIRNYEDFGDKVPLPVEKDSIGIIVKVSENEVEFVHRSFGEYFAASFLSKNRQFVVKFPNFLSDKKYNNVRFFFDLLLAKHSRAHVAVLYRNVQLLEKCTEEELTIKDDGGRNVLQLACTWGEKYKVGKVVKKSDSCEIFLDCSFDSDNIEYCKMFSILSKKCDRHCHDNLFDMDALSYAAKAHCLMSYAKLLHPHEVDFENCYNLEEICSIICYCVKFDYVRIFQIVKNIPKIIVSGSHPLSHFAVVFNSIKCVKHLSKLWPEDVKNLAMAACELGRVNIVKYFVNSTASETVKFQNIYNKTLLHIASRYNRTNIVKLLVRNNAKVNAVDTSDATSLHYAREVRIVKVLIDNGANVTITDYQGNTALHAAAKLASPDVITFLIRCKADVNCQNTSGQTPLHVACLFNNTKNVKALIENKADVNAKDCKGETALHICCRFGRSEIVELLLESGAEMYFFNDNRETPLDVAEECNWAEVVRILLDKDCSFCKE